ncbi:MAG: hypothetical protein N5P05_002595 [Chroococcopsis gigantea SAG 12.99]|jgi:hypothetical protein|nr:hypothetical protein [Chlorogloea purpurea SAG 13.99]MDV3000989.1 hypothetical protein [Chroococcopsis gigantea SAG 12.99]
MSEGKYTGYERILELVQSKNKSLPKGISLKVEYGKYLRLQFVDPATNKRTSKPTGESLTEEGIILASAKAVKIHEALGKFTKASEFWEWYDKEVLGKNQVKNDLVTYREIFTQIEDKYFKGVNKNTKLKRSREQASDLASFNRAYTDIFNRFTNWDKYPEWTDIEKVLYSWKQGSKSFKNAYFVLKRVAGLCPNKEALLEKLDGIEYDQTDFKEKQSIDIDTFLLWHERTLAAIDGMTNKRDIESRVNWVWVASMCVLYGLRPTEIAAAQNLFSPFTVDGVTIPALNSPNNKELLLYLGDFTYFGIRIKTGKRVCKPMVTDRALIERLKIQEPNLPIYTPKEGSKPDSICNGFNNQFTNRMISWKLPITDKYAFRHLANQLGEKYGIPQEIRARLLGHSTAVNENTYKKRSNIRTSIDLITNHSKQPLSLDMAKQALTNNGFDINQKEVKAILKMIYQLDDW